MESKSRVSQQFLLTIPTAMSYISQTIKNCAEGDLGMTQFRILSNIDEGINRVKDIAEINGVSQPAISKMVDLMVTRGLIRRQRDDRDRRSMVLDLTIKGREVFQGVEMKAVERMLEKMNQMDDHEVLAIQKALSMIDGLVHQVKSKEL